MIKEIKTEKFEGIAVLLPDDFKEYAGANNNELYYWTETCTQRMGDYPYSVHVPNILQYEILGKATEIPEEECRDIVSMFSSPYLNPSKYVSYSNMDLYNSASESFQSLMYSLGCYSINPYGEEKPQTVFYHKGEEEAVQKVMESFNKKWDELQANTGTWLILKKL